MKKPFTFQNFLAASLKGIGQVMFQNNWITGLLFLIGIFYSSWLMGIGATLGVIASTSSALILKYAKKDIQNGLYGFNGTLIGIALCFFFEPSTYLCLAIILASCVSTLIMHFMYKNNLAPYTFPFVITTWFFIVAVDFFQLFARLPSELFEYQSFNILSSVSLGFSQVMFQASIITGLLFFVGILINSRISAIYALLGAGLGAFFGLLFFPSSLNLVNLGIFGFNGVLCGIALSGKRISDFLFAILAITLSIFVIKEFQLLSLVALTFPFVFSTWIIILIKKAFKVAESKN